MTGRRESESERKLMVHSRRVLKGVETRSCKRPNKKVETEKTKKEREKAMRKKRNQPSYLSAML
jgi:hypothetical protein